MMRNFQGKSNTFRYYYPFLLSLISKKTLHGISHFITLATWQLLWQQSQGKCHSRSFRVIIFCVDCFSFCFLCLMALGYGCPECSLTGKFFKFSRDLHCSLQNLQCDLIWHFCREGEKQRNKEKCKPHVQKHEGHRGGSRIFF